LNLLHSLGMGHHLGNSALSLVDFLGLLDLIGQLLLHKPSSQSWGGASIVRISALSLVDFLGLPDLIGLLLLPEPTSQFWGGTSKQLCSLIFWLIFWVCLISVLADAAIISCLDVIRVCFNAAVRTLFAAGVDKLLR
jgi:hypothetical protein